MSDNFDSIKINPLDIDIEFEGEKREFGTLTYHKWRNAVFTRDLYTCQRCYKKFPKEELEAHHIKPFSVAPELQFDTKNGLTLCHDCHVKTDSYGRHSRSRKRRANTHEKK